MTPESQPEDWPGSAAPATKPLDALIKSLDALLGGDERDLDRFKAKLARIVRVAAEAEARKEKKQ